MITPATSKLGRVYDCRPPRADHPLVKLAVPHPVHDGSPLPAAVDLIPLARPVRDQGQRGYCYAFATAAFKEVNCAVWGGSKAPLGGDLSPEYIGWRTQLAEGTWPNDVGASVADALSVVHSYGVCPDSFLPYGPTPTPGNPACDVAAAPYRAGVPCTVDFSDANNPKAVLAQSKPIVIGFTVLASFENTGPSGIVAAPSGSVLGGHAVLVVGYDATGWVIRNSWGTGWARGGYCTFPYGVWESQIFESWTTPPSPPGQ